MPWCQTCDRQLADDELVASDEAGVSGSDARDCCPTCGSLVGQQVEDSGDATEPGAPGEDGEEDRHVKAPWHFKVLIVGTVGYLGYRLYQGIGWLIHHA